jgi:tetratricopeptide (TPR) repeat protein
MRLRRLLLAVALLLDGLAGPRLAHADRFWARIAGEDSAQAEAALRQGRKLLEAADDAAAGGAERRDLRERAALALGRAVRGAPLAAEPHFLLGRALYGLERTAEAVAELERARNLDPRAPFLEDLAFLLGVALTRVGEFERAVSEYDRALALGQSREAQAITLSNSAESCMAMGRLEEAIRRYRRAVDLAPGYALGWHGLAVALDRDEQGLRAQQAMAHALAADPGLELVRGESVFFVPAAEIHYYLALAHEAQGRPDLAAAEWQRFLSAVPDSQFAARARAHLAALRVAGSAAVADPNDASAHRRKIRPPRRPPTGR